MKRILYTERNYWNPIHLKKSLNHMLNFTGHLQRAQLKTEMQNINNYGIYITL